MFLPGDTTGRNITNINPTFLSIRVFAEKNVYGKYIKSEYISFFFNNWSFLHTSHVLFHFYSPCNISYFNFLIFITRSRDFSRQYRENAAKSAPGTLTVPVFGRLHDSAPKYYNFVCAGNNPHPLPDSAPTSPRAGDPRVTRSRFAIPPLFCHPTPPPMRRPTARCPRRILNFLRNWMRRGSSPRFAAFATAARERVTDVVTSACSIWLRQRSTLCARLWLRDDI